MIRGNELEDQAYDPEHIAHVLEEMATNFPAYFAAFAEGLIDGFHRWCKSTNAWRLNEIMFELRYLRDYAAAYAAGDRSLFLNDEQFMFDQAERWRRVSQIAHGAHSRTPYLSGYLGRDAA